MILLQTDIQTVKSLILSCLGLPAKTVFEVHFPLIFLEQLLIPTHFPGVSMETGLGFQELHASACSCVAEHICSACE